ncbi:mechanosensitive ion channel family protein [Sulfurovum riftiae]|uniref:Mechanosensitive ion channel protein MscS n=1 Tax=Sulfurovum riftiae TaxID=1630136 RepID=A0A151CGS6_9BACT|nr:mechanosensitive ion channel domain-containing protein [Sulfurovum riftiae]KYJ86738.1 hypothetical protein AS592_07885 [Sulfurovum riftiae]
MNKILKLCFITVLLHQLQAADLNTSLILADKTVYSALLEKVEKRDPKSGEVLLQKALLNSLVSLPDSQAKKRKTFTQPKDPKEVKSLLSGWFDILSEKEKLESQKEMLLDKMATLKSQINSSMSQDPSLLTYQLQYAFYAKNKRSLEKQIEMFEQEAEQIETLLHQLPKTLRIQEKSLGEARKKLLDYYSLQEKKLKTLQIEKERLKLLGDEAQLDAFGKNASKEQQIYANISKELVAIDFLLFCDALQKKDQKALDWEQKILKQRQDSSGKPELIKLLKDMEREYLGIMNTLGGTTVQGVKYTVDSVWKLLKHPLFEINNTPVNIMNMFIVLVIFILGFLIGGFFKRIIQKAREDDSEFTVSSRILLANTIYYLIIFIAFFTSMKVLGINLSSLAIVAGALSVGIGFGLKNIVSNFVSGIILMLERSIKIGDYIELDENLRGHVTDISMRSTTISTNANIDVIIPNQNFIQNNVINWTMNDNIKRFEIPFGVKYGTKPQKVIDAVLKAVKESGFKDIYHTKTRFTRVVMTEMGESSVNFELFVWVKGKEILYPKRTTSRFLILIYDALYANDIEIPFPQRDLHIRSVDAEITFPVALDKASTDKEVLKKN